MLAKLKTYSLLGIHAVPVEVEVDVSPGAVPKTVLVGLPEAAVRLFFILRQLDAAGVDEIICEPVAERGLGVAIMDRLRRAAATAPEA